MNYERYFADAIAGLKAEGRYRVFADLERCVGRFPQATYRDAQQSLILRVATASGVMASSRTGSPDAMHSPAAIRDALVGQARKLEKGLSFGRAKRLIGNGLVMAEGEDHQRQRRLMQPAFHRAQIAGYLGTMREVAVPRISAWRDGETLAFDREMRSITLTVLTRTLLSSDVCSETIDA